MYLRMVLIAAAGALPALALWYLLLRRLRTAGLPARQLATAALAAGLLCRVAFALGTPTFYAPDEQAHFRYVGYLVEHRALPVQTSRMNAATNDWEYYQPPLYYLALTPAYGIADRLFHDDAVTLRVLRLLSIALWVATVWFALRFLDQAGVGDGFVRATVVAMLALLPTYVFLSAVINNDNLLIALGSAVLWRASRPASLVNALALGVLVGLALLTKLSAVVYVSLLLLLPAVGRLRRTRAPWAARSALLATAVAVVLWAPWAWRSQHLYGSVTAENVANIRRPWASPSEAVLGTFTYMQETFWAAAGVYNTVRFHYPFAGRHLAYFAGLGLLLGLTSRRERLRRVLPANRDLDWAMALALLANGMLVMRFGVLYGQGQGRFLFPMLIPAALFLGAGLRMFALTEREAAPLHVTGFFITYATSFTVYALAYFPRGATPWGPGG